MFPKQSEQEVEEIRDNYVGLRSTLLLCVIVKKTIAFASVNLRILRYSISALDKLFC
jgi:hypothetical protein